MKGIGYYSGQRITYDEDQRWAVVRSVTYLAAGVICLLLSLLLFVIAYYIFAPTWFYIIPTGTLIAGMLLISVSEGIEIDTRKGAVIKWRKALGVK